MTNRWSQLLLVQIGGAICLPVLTIGFLLGQQLGLKKALISIIFGNVILAVMACYMSFIAIKFKQNTPEIAQSAFGKKAGWIFSFVFLLNLMGWFGINLVTMASMISTRYFLADPFATRLAMLGLGLMITISVLGGLQWLERMAKYLLPFLMWGMVKMTSSEAYTLAWNKTQMGSLSIFGIGLVISGLFACVIDMPTYFCRARSLKDGIIASLLLFLVFVPVIEILGLGIGSPSESYDLATKIFKESSGLMADVFLLFCLFAGWTTNNCNLFSAQTFLIQLLPKIERFSYRKRILFVGAGGIFFGLMGSIISFENLLISISSPLLIAGAFLMLLTGRKFFLERSIHDY